MLKYSWQEQRFLSIGEFSEQYEVYCDENHIRKYEGEDEVDIEDIFPDAI